MRLLSDLLCAVAAVVLCAAATPALAKPNIVVILADDQDDTGSMAYMPKVLALIAKQGITFTNSFVNFSTCTPSRVSFLTGQAAHNHGIRSNNEDKGGGWDTFQSDEHNTLPVWLERAGYNTALIGKYINGYGKRDDNDVTPTSQPPGWDHWFAFADSAGYYRYQINQNGVLKQFDDEPSDYSTDVLRDEAVEFIRKQSGSKEPFFMLVTPKAPHRGGTKGSDLATPAPRHAGLFPKVTLPNFPAFNEKDVSDKPPWVRRSPDLGPDAKERFEAIYQSRLQTLQAVDDLVEAIVKSLQETGKLDDTYVIYTADNGFAYGEHRLRGKVNAYEGSIRVPLLIRGPGVPHGQTRTQLVNNLDVVATIEQIAGATPGLVPDGQSLVPLFANADAPWRSAILIEGGHERIPEGDRQSKRKSPKQQSWLSWAKQTLFATWSGPQPSQRLFYGVRTPTRKYVQYGDGFEELYDLNADPYELENKASDPAYAGDRDALRKTNAKLKTCAGQDCWVP
jgi:arylsulfatase A-like enzyme